MTPDLRRSFKRRPHSLKETWWSYQTHPGLNVLTVFQVEDVFNRKGKHHVAGLILGYGTTHGHYVSFPVDSLLVEPSVFTYVGSNMSWLKPNNYVTRKEGGTGTLADNEDRDNPDFTFAFRVYGVGGGSGSVSVALEARPTPWGVWVGNNVLVSVSVGLLMTAYRPSVYPEIFEAAGMYNHLKDLRARAIEPLQRGRHITTLDPNAILFSSGDTIFLGESQGVDLPMAEPVTEPVAETVEAIQGPVMSRFKQITSDPF